MNQMPLEMPKFVEYEPIQESNNVDSKILQELKNVEYSNIQKINNIISRKTDEQTENKTNFVENLLHDSIKIAETDKECAASIFSRFLTLINENSCFDIQIEEKIQLNHFENIYGLLEYESKQQSLALYMYLFNKSEDVFNHQQKFGFNVLYDASDLLAKMYKADQKLHELLDLIELLKKRNEEIKKRNEVITTCINQLIKFKLFKKVDELIEQVGLPCDAQTSLNQLKELLNSNDVTKEQVENALDKQDELRNSRADEQTHYQLVKVMSKVGMINEAMNMLKEVTEEFFNFDQTVFNVVLDGCAKFGKIVEMQEILNLMDTCGFPLTIVGYNTIIDGLIRANHNRKAWDVLESMLKFNIQPDHYTISTLCRGIKGPENDRQFNKIIEIQQSYKDNLESKTTVMYNCLIEACVLSKHFELALKFFEEFKQDNSEEEKPDLVTFNILLKGYAYNQDINSALKLVEEMKRNSLIPCKQTQNTLIDLTINLNKIDLAQNIIDEMKSNNIIPDQQTQSTLIKGMKKQTRQISKEDCYNKMFNWLNELTYHTNQIDCVLQNCIMDTCISYRDIEKTQEVQDTMLKHNIEPNQVTFGILIKAYGMNQDLNKCFEIFDNQMIKRRVEVNEFTQGALLEACIKNKNLKKARDVYERLMKDSKVKMNTVLYSTILKLLNLERKLKQSKIVQNTMLEKQETYPNNITQNTLIDTACKCGDIEFAFELFDRMKKEGHKHDLVTYGSFVKGLQKAKKSNKLIEIMTHAKNEQIRLDELFVKTLFKNKSDEVIKAINELKSNKFKLNDEIMNQITRFYTKKNENIDHFDINDQDI